MRKIEKEDTPEWLDSWKEVFEKSSGNKPRYEDLDDQNRIKLRKLLVAEQGYICCYCMRRIGVNSSHIEHFRPRHGNPELELEYRNLFASCTGQEREPRFTLWHCDTKKEDWFNDNMPELTSDGIEKSILYKLDGTVTAYHKGGSFKNSVENEMIEHLGLMAPYLVRNRRLAIQSSELMEDLDYSSDDWAELIRYYDEKHDGMYEEYCGMFTQVIFRECLD